MKYAIIAITMLLSACAEYAPETNAAEDSAAHQAWLEYLYTNYDPEYIEDCLYYKLDCDFE